MTDEQIIAAAREYVASRGTTAQPRAYDLARVLVALAERDDMRSNVLGRIAIAARGEHDNNLTDEHCVAEVERMRRDLTRLEAVARAASQLSYAAEEWECDGLGLFAQHGHWEPLHDALESLSLQPTFAGFGCNPLGKCSEPRCADCPEGILVRERKAAPAGDAPAGALAGRCGACARHPGRAAGPGDDRAA